MSGHRPRRNLIERTADDFRPPTFKPNASAWNRAGNWARRFLDLQAGTIWHDLRAELAAVEGRLLDIGCGAQIYRDLVPAGVTYRGIDTADAKARFGYHVPDTDYFEGEDWPVAPASYDTVLCTEVLEHIPEPSAFLTRAKNCLRPGGRLILTVPFAARWHFIPYDYWRYTPSTLNTLLSHAGFDDIIVHARGNPLTVACYKTMALPLGLLLTPGGELSFVKRVAGVALLPVLGLIACIANLTLHNDWGDDCIGYTVTARRASCAN
jgi:SAM-dependent methyltransferase